MNLPLSFTCLSACPKPLSGFIHHRWRWPSYNYISSCWRTQHRPPYSHLALSKLGWWKRDKWVPRELTKDKTIVTLKCHLLLFCTTMNHFLVGLWHATKSRFYTTTGDVLPKAKLVPKQGHGNCGPHSPWWSAAGLIHYSFLNPAKTIISEKHAQHIDETHQKLQCLRPTLINTRARFSTTTPGCTLHNHHFRGGRTGLWSFARAPWSQQASASQQPLPHTSQPRLAGETLPQPGGGRKCFPRIRQIPKHGFLCYRNKLISHW